MYYSDKGRKNTKQSRVKGTGSLGVQQGSLQYLIEWTHEVSLKEDSCALNAPQNNNHFIQLLNFNVSSW